MSRYFEKMPGAELVELLKLRDQNAWRHVFEQAVIPAMFTRRARQIMIDRKITPPDVWGMLFEYMMTNDHLDGYRGGSVIGWMKITAVGLLLRECEKNPRPVSSEDFENVQIDEGKKEDMKKLAEIELARQCFRKLWEKNARMALILLLRQKLEMTTAQIRIILGEEITETNIDQIAHRATEEMKVLRAKEAL